jgi:Tfp pilus assembly protein PilV
MKSVGMTVHHLYNRQGFTLFEIFLTLLILAIVITPMVNAFAPSLLSSSQEEEQAVLTAKVRSTMNRLLDLDFRTLDANRGNPANLTTLFGSAGAAAEENLSYMGQSYVPFVGICAVDASGVPVSDCVTDASDGTAGLLGLKVSLKNVTLQSLKAAR